MMRFVACAAAVAAGCCTVERPGYDTLIAHRGESVDAPENTLPAYMHVWTVDDLADTLEAFRRGAQTVTTNCAKKQLDEYRKAAK